MHNRNTSNSLYLSNNVNWLSYLKLSFLFSRECCSLDHPNAHLVPVETLSRGYVRQLCWVSSFVCLPHKTLNDALKTNKNGCNEIYLSR